MIFVKFSFLSHRQVKSSSGLKFWKIDLDFRSRMSNLCKILSVHVNFAFVAQLKSSKSFTRALVVHVSTKPNIHFTRLRSGRDFISSRVIFSIWPNYRLMPDIQLATRIVWLNPFLFCSAHQCIGTICEPSAMWRSELNKSCKYISFSSQFIRHSANVCHHNLGKRSLYLYMFGRYILNDASNGFRMPFEQQYNVAFHFGAAARTQDSICVCICGKHASKAENSIRMQYERKLTLTQKQAIGNAKASSMHGIAIQN